MSNIHWTSRQKSLFVKGIENFVINNKVDLPLSYKELEFVGKLVQDNLRFGKIRRNLTGYEIEKLVKNIHFNSNLDWVYMIVAPNVKNWRDLTDWTGIKTEHVSMIIIQPLVKTVKPIVNKETKAFVSKDSTARKVLVVGPRAADAYRLEQRYKEHNVIIVATEGSDIRNIQQIASSKDLSLAVVMTQFSSHAAMKTIKRFNKTVPRISVPAGASSCIQFINEQLGIKMNDLVVE